MNRAEKRRKNKITGKALKEAKALPLIFKKAVEHQKNNNLTEAESLYKKILEINYNLPEVHCNLGSIQNIHGDNFAAEKSFRHSISLKANYADAHGNLGNTLIAMGRLNEAIASYKEALIHNPEGANLHNSLGTAMQKLGRHSNAIHHFKIALSITPNFAEALSNLGISLKEIECFEEAIQNYERALSIKPDFSEAHSNKGNVLKDLGQLEEASNCYKKALAIRPDYAEAKCNLGGVLLSMGQLDEALNCYEETLEHKPDHPLAANNYLHTVLYKPSVSNDELFKIYSNSANNRKSKNYVKSLPTTFPKLEERIRIGYISSDFREHPLGRNVLPIFSNHDRKKFEIFCYAELSKPDHLTNEFQKLSDHWRMIKGLTNFEVAEKISTDQIHVLVFLGGQFDENQPSIAAMRLANVQISLFGGTTTAIENMDYWLTDNMLHPENTTEQFTEELWHLPTLFNYPTPKGAPAINLLPASKNGYVTFASFNKPCKMNNDVLDLWSEVLNAVPNSKLNLKFINFLSTRTISNRILDRFEKNNVSLDRINLISEKESFYDHLARYNQVDIALDTFPFSGATTTFQALWMGVPVISLLGDRFITRMGGSITAQIGLNHVLADTPKEFFSHATSLATNINHLQELRSSLRKKISNSLLCDGITYTQNLETAYQKMLTKKTKTQI